MADKCNTPDRNCPFDTDTIKEFGTMQGQIADIHKMLMNGNGLLSRVNALERWRAYVIGIAFAVSAIVGFIVKFL